MRRPTEPNGAAHNPGLEEFHVAMVSSSSVKIVNSKEMDVSNNRGTPKWMVYNGKPY